MKKAFTEVLGRGRLYCDGGSGSLLQARGLKPGELPERWNLTRREDIVQLAEGYLRAGSDIVNTNTFGANALKYPGEVGSIVRAAVDCVREAQRRCGREEDSYVALDIGPTGRLLQPMGDLAFEEAVSLFGEIARAGAEAGADLVLIETMSDSYEVKAAVLGVKEACGLPVCVTMTYDAGGKLLTGGTVESTTAMLEGLGVSAVGINCGLGPSQMISLAGRLLEAASVPVIVNPNAGLPRVEDGRTVYDVGPEEFSREMEKIASLGAHVLGGCCGTTPAHIEALIRATRRLPFREPTEKNRTVVTSFSKTVEIGRRPVLIGERINPTGKKRFQQALREGNIDYILGQAIEQEDSGADILDVNVGLPDIDEPAMMENVVTRLQAVTALPLQIDTSDPAALERGLRLYNGKPMVNSVNGKAESIEAVMPIVRKYGGVLVGLALDESGIPETAEGRLAVADRIYEAADRCGIPRKDIVIDGLALTVSSDSGSALVTLETLRKIRDLRQGHSILGVSNISFGLPRREVINSTFFTMAMLSGLSCAIINPNNEAMMRAYRAYLALSDMDPQCMGYIEASALWSAENGPSGGKGPESPGGSVGGAGKAGHNGHDGNAGETGNAGRTQGSAGPAGGLTLADCVVRGLKERAAKAAEAELTSREAADVIDRDLIPALDVVGRGFEKGTVFLPQLLMSAEAAQAAFQVIKEKLSGRPSAVKGTVILATVKNDIHDIGKNIVKVMLENYGYQVVDLGKDVPPELIVKTAVERDLRLVGLSALMTTTVPSMEETIRQLRAAKPDVKVVVGGAVMTQEYADRIGADAYAKDAMETVRYADRVFGELKADEERKE